MGHGVTIGLTEGIIYVLLVFLVKYLEINTMRSLYLVVLLLASVASAQANLNLNEVFNNAQPSSIAEKNLQLAAMCFKTGERTSGMNKICFYDCLGSATAITIKSHELCPYTINR
tara:strand:- start:225 stop:569 length:345 start_codon:yes stop_codon:yes gene_type:complete